MPDGDKEEIKEEAVDGPKKSGKNKILGLTPEQIESREREHNRKVIKFLTGGK